MVEHFYACLLYTSGMVSLTGSVEAGIQTMAAASTNVTKVSLELGGKAPGIVTVSYTHLGVTTGILPWNFPFFLIARKAAPALLTGKDVYKRQWQRWLCGGNSP